MSRICEILGKKTSVGNNVSHSNIKSKRKFYPNLQEKKIFLPEEKEWISMKLSTKAIRTINKLGVFATLKKAQKKGTLSKNLERYLKNSFSF